MAIVGAGPTGMVLALELARHGVRPRVFDRARGRLDGRRATDIHSRTLELLDAHGVLPRLLARGKTVRRFNAYADGRLVSHLDFDALESPYPFTLSIPQRETEAVLEEAMRERGLSVERGATLDAVRTGDGVTLFIERDGERRVERARFAVGADGVGSRTRASLAIPYDGVTYVERYLVADVALDWRLPDDEVHLFMHHEGFLNVIALPGRQVRVLADRGVADTRPPSLDVVRTLLGRRTHLNFELRSSTLVRDFRIQRRLAAHYSVGDVFIAGDAAHTCSPLLGQGMNLGLHDAAALAWRLAAVIRGDAPRSLLDEYEAERRPIGRGILTATDLAHRLSRLRAEPLCRMRDAAFRLGSSIPALRRAAAQITATSGSPPWPGGVETVRGHDAGVDDRSRRRALRPPAVSRGSSP